MLATDILLLLSGVVMAIAIGAMLLLITVVTPAVFAALGSAEAGRVLRAVFPRYDLALGVTAGLAAVLSAAALATAPGDGGRLLWPVPIALACVAIASLAVRSVLTPRIAARREAMLSGDAAAGEAFRRLHRGSVILALVQLVTLVACLGWTLFG